MIGGGASRSARGVCVGLTLVLGTLVLSVGCDSRPVSFDRNLVRAMSLERSRDVPTSAALDDVSIVIDELFGTPDSPKWPTKWTNNSELVTLVSVDNLGRAAGSVRSDQENRHDGLYQEHCVVCHGIAGSGTGPAARFQLPYPRDFRAGVFKWKSTERSDQPTRVDLHALLVHGVPGSPMPSFANVAISDREALVDYVIYLSVRGQTERELLAAAVDELGYHDTPPDDDWRLVSPSGGLPDPSSSAAEVIRDVVTAIATEWAEATSTPLPQQRSSMDLETIARGDAIFHGPIANCVGCHGKGGQGGTPTLDHDDWTKEFTTRIGITPGDLAATQPFVKAGALPPRLSQPRNLATAAYRGGDDPATIYRRIQHGIAGTPMPGIEVSETASGLGLTPDQVWDLVAYLKAIRDEW